MEKKKNAIILSGVVIFTLIVLIIGSTYAYFQASGGTGTNTDVKVTTYTTDVFNFEVGSDISIYADATSFASGKGNASGSTFAKAILTANNKTNTSTKNYYMYLDITNNSFVYTQNEDVPELILTITDKDKNEVTTIPGLKHKEVTDGKGTIIKGFDITNKNGLVTLFDNREIVANPQSVEEWIVTITLVNYNANQNANTGKNFSAKLKIESSSLDNGTISICDAQTKLVDCIKTQFVSNKDNVGILYHDSTLVNGAKDNSYRYSGGKGYTVTKKAEDEGYNSLDKLIVSNGNTYIINYDKTKNYNYYLDAILKAVSDGYVTSNLNNFVCFGTDEKICSKDNLYRIIGIFSQDSIYYTKLIKAFGDQDSLNNWSYSTSIGDDYNNRWDSSPINSYLNDTFLQSLGTWKNKIYSVNWNVAGIHQDLLNSSVKNVYNKEIVTLNPYTGTIFETCMDDPDNCSMDPSEIPIYENKYYGTVGLMYVSDFGYAASKNNWTKNIGGYSNSIDNWMDIEENEWTITRATNIEGAYVIENGSPIDAATIESYIGRPAFYLNSSIKYLSGDGSVSSPIRIS